MSITLNVPQYSVTEDTVYWNDLFEEHKNLPMLCIGRDSYIEETQVKRVRSRICCTVSR